MEFPLNILPPEMIDLIADKLSIMDCLNAQKAFARDPKKDIRKNIRNGLAVNLAKQSALYLLMDTDEYDSKYQYNYQLESQLPNALLSTLKGLPIASECSKMITLPELERISIGRLKETFPKVVELKVVLRDSSFLWLTKLAKVVEAFSKKLTALQLLIFSDFPGMPPGETLTFGRCLHSSTKPALTICGILRCFLRTLRKRSSILVT